MKNSSLSVQDIVEFFGNQSILARTLYIKPQSVQEWVSTNHLPIRRAIQIEQITEGKIRLNDILGLTGIGEVAEITNPIVPKPPPTKLPESSWADQDRRGELRLESDKGDRVNHQERAKRGPDTVLLPVPTE